AMAIVSPHHGVWRGLRHHPVIDERRLLLSEDLVATRRQRRHDHEPSTRHAQLHRGILADSGSETLRIVAPHAGFCGRFGQMTETPSGLKYEDTVVGAGASPAAGQTCVMHYTGWLWVNGAKGSKFDSSVDRGRPFEFPIGRGRVIKGWDEGVATMKIGG